ncbi:MAG: NFYB/HAP3 family transcription factor subunit [Spirochaetales bacterium]|nr:NFYB/HAP3 family transcription factor subunit [Spirochaetales bacterium]
MSDKVTLVVTSKVKGVVKGAGLLCSSTFIEALSDKVRELTLQAVENAKADKRKTVKDRDL